MFRPKVITRRAVYRLSIFAGVLLALGTWAWATMIRMPGEGHRGPLPGLTAGQSRLRDALEHDVTKLAGEIGERNDRQPGALEAAADFIAADLERYGLPVDRQAFGEARQFENVEAQIAGSREIVVVGAHYDTARGSPGANDNASGVAALLALARAFVGSRPARTLRFVAFTNEEPPHFQNPDMGSFVYARRCRGRRERVVAMISLETMGWFSDREGSQSYPFPFSLFYPSRGNFITFVGSYEWRSYTRRVVRSFRRAARFPSEGGAPLAFIPGVGWSDHWSFWQNGYPGVMVTDTAPFRYPHYHSAQDTPDKVDFARLARVVDGLRAVVRELVGERP